MHPSLALTRATCTFSLSRFADAAALRQGQPRACNDKPHPEVKQCTSRATRLARLPLPQARPLGRGSRTCATAAGLPYLVRAKRTKCFP